MFRMFALGSALLGAWCLGGAAGDDTDAPSRFDPQGVAIIDMARVFQESPRLARLRDDLRVVIEDESVEAKAQAEQLKALKQRLDATKEGTDERRELGEEFQQKNADLKALAQKLQADFGAREAEMYRAFYEDVRTQVEEFATERGIGLVIRYQKSGESIGPVEDAKDTREALSRINQLVVYHAELDITDDVIERLKEAGTL